MEQTKIIEKRFAELVKSKVRCVYLEKTSQIDEVVPKTENTSTVPESSTTTLACSFCKTEFDDVSKQREHYKLDWHRYNLKRSISGREPLTEEQFIERNDDLSSISGSDSEKEDNLDTIASARGKIFLENTTTKTVFSLYKCLLFNKKEEIIDTILQQRLQALAKSDKWCILMLGGGHFAGAIFHKDIAILHKTFHCYTVRAGQGGGQSGRDNKSGGSTQPKSAGASLRRYNEQSLIQHVRDIVDSWKNEIAECNIIMYRASGPYNRAVLFDGKPPILERNDIRLRTIPFSTRRPTFSEVKRVYELLVSIQIYNSLNDATKHFKQDTRRTKTKNNSINRAKSREIVSKSQLFERNESTSTDEEEVEDNSDLLENLDKLTIPKSELITQDQEISFKDTLQAFDDSLTADERKRIYVKKKAPKKSKNKKIKEREEKRKQQTIDLIKNGDLDGLKAFFETYINSNCEIESDADIKIKIFNEILDVNNNTPLHLASVFEKGDTVKYLLENDANPCSKNTKQQTPYTITQNKEIREIFKQFAQENPHKYNYNKANIPLIVVSAEEVAEKKRQQRKHKKEKEKVKRKENQLKKEEELEKQKFLKLSDAEKRELRSVSRCFLCGADMTGKIPFEYLQNSFCSVGCVKEHKMKHGIVLS